MDGLQVRMTPILQVMKTFGSEKRSCLPEALGLERGRERWASCLCLQSTVGMSFYLISFSQSVSKDM